MINSRILLLICLNVLPATIFGQRGTTETKGQDYDIGEMESARAGVPQNYDIYVGKDRVGTYEAVMRRDGRQMIYTAESETTVRLVGQIRISYELECVYEDGMLVRSDYSSYKNGKLRNKTDVKWTGQSYRVNRDGEAVSHSDPIRMSNILLYFRRPDGVRKTFSESEAVVKEIRPNGDANYLVAPPGEDKGTEYIYEGDDLARVHMRVAMFDCVIVRR